jgi:hypothetical protein
MFLLAFSLRNLEFFGLQGSYRFVLINCRHDMEETGCRALRFGDSYLQDNLVIVTIVSISQEEEEPYWGGSVLDR